MKISGFSIARNISKFDYPAVESINSILPICDNFVVAVGNSEDDTLAKIKSIHPAKINILETIWDDTKRVGGIVLADETNKAFQAIENDADWCFYIQADEVVHEDDLNIIYESCKEHLNNNKVEGLLFKYKHFYGSYDYIATSRKWYNSEVRIIRNNKKIKSYKDAQGFRLDSRKLKVKAIDAYINHYGWVKHPLFQQKKQEHFNKLWHDDVWIKQNVPKQSEFDYSNIDKLEKFTGTHPLVMYSRVESQNWHFDFDITKNNKSTKNKILDWLENISGKEIARYRNYELI